MRLSLSEIKSRAISFANEWKDTTDEDAEGKSFLDAFLNVFGVSRRRVAAFEIRVKKIGNRDGYIDLLWKGTLLIEQKSTGQNLDKAYKQAIDYFPGLTEDDLPSHILVSDFQNFRLYDLDNNKQYDFKLVELHKKIHLFDFISGYTKKEYKEEDPVNIAAAELLGDLHDALLASNYSGHPLEVFLVRILFCLFADDTGIFQPRDHFTFFIEKYTHPDGSDLGQQLNYIFQVLNTPESARQKNTDEEINRFPYVNGDLYRELLLIPALDKTMRDLILKCCHFDWSRISPAVFGSLFQSIMNKEKRRALGAHYTSEKNIMKVVRGLFLDDLHERFEKSKNNPRKLKELHNEIAGLKFLDPACGCGNFLVITYRELRLLELDILKLLQKGQQVTKINDLSLLNVDAFYGIEIEEWPARIAEVAMWLMDHQMNVRLGEEFGLYDARIPLTTKSNFVNGNALRLDWESIVPKNELNFILGNPPFVGTAYQSEEQKKDMSILFNGVRSFGMLDYVTCWYIKASQYIQNTKIKVAFVSTNSITQGEQPGVLWNVLFNKYHIKIHFAHQTFKWNNEARGMAAVHVVIIGFANFDSAAKFTYEYETLKSEPHQIIAKNINPYLVVGDDLTIGSINKPICDVPLMQSGSALRDGGFLILSEDEKNELEKKYRDTMAFVMRFISGDDFINNKIRWCLWLKEASPGFLRSNKFIVERLEKVKQFRLKSTRAGTRKMANYPSLFAEERQPDSDFLLIPKVSSENRKYIPIGYLTAKYVITDKSFFLSGATLFHFAILTSSMHMSWMRRTCGRLKSDYSYSNTIVYNNFPWPKQVPMQKIKNVEEKAKRILKVREQFAESSLADLYDPLSMPAALVKAHDELDKAVDNCYTTKTFPTELSRLEYLFALYRKYTEPMFGGEKKKRK